MPVNAFPPSVPNGQNEFGLANLDPKTGEVPQCRIGDVKAAWSIYGTLLHADEKSAAVRSKHDAMFDGAPPYDQKVLASTGQGARTNLNFGEAQRYLDIAMSAYVDLYTSLERLMHIILRKGDPVTKGEKQDIIADELSHFLRSCPEFHSNYLRLCTEFTKHGVGVAYFDDPKSWRFRVCGLSDFLIPRQTMASEEYIEVAAARRPYLLHDLYGFISDEAVATTVGWNVAEVKRVMIANATTSGHRNGFASSDWESLQREFKNNDIYTGLENTSVSVIHMWVREITGKVSLLMFAENNPQTFLYKGESLFEKPEQAYILFAYGVGTNGTYHSVRGYGHRIFNHVQTSNRARCQFLDSAMMSGAIMLKPDTQRALDDLSFTMYGPYSILSPNVEVVEKAIPNLSQSLVPALQDLERQLAANVDPVSTYRQQASPYRNELQTEHDLAVSSALTGTTINLFYASWSRLLREVTRRITTSGKRDPKVAEFFARCLERGVTEEDIANIDHSKTAAVRAIGAGSAANRLLALRELNAISGSYDEVGRRNLIRDITAERVGRDLVDRYAPAAPEPRTTVDTKVAMLENQLMQSGQMIPVLDTELHGQHLRVHAPLLNQLVSGIQSGEIDPVETIQLLDSVYQHTSQHAQYLASDPAAKAEVASIKQLLQVAEEVLTNTGRKIQAEQRKAMEAQAQAEAPPVEGGPEVSPAMLKLQEHELKMRITEEKAALDSRIKEQKAMQEFALKDAERAMSLEGTETNR